jgi:hypothetical protein
MVWAHVGMASSGTIAHYQLADHLDQPSDWDAEFESDLQDLRALIETIQHRWLHSQ